MSDATREGNAGATSWHRHETLASVVCPSAGSSEDTKRANGPPLVFVWE